VYGFTVYKKYSELNDNKNALKNLSSYDISVNGDVLSDYTD
jgi:hypothetical protein